MPCPTLLGLMFITHCSKYFYLSMSECGNPSRDMVKKK